jgi:hypothetical protein
MNLIKPDSKEHRRSILSNLTTNLGRRLGLRMKPYEASAVRDISGYVHWMYVFDEHESRIYRTQRGTQRMADIDLGDDKLMDLDETSDRIRSAVKKLMAENY